jgi:hypothetical protein
MEAVAAERTAQWRWWAWLPVGALVLCAGLFQVHNLDWPLHDVTGRWILEHGEVPDTNVLSELHGDHPSVHDKWGFQVLTHLLVEAAGPEALIALRVLLLAVMLVLVAATARGLGASPASALATLALAVVAARSRFLARPDLASLVLLSAFVYVALVARPDGRRAGWILVPLQLLWVNLHGYFLLGWLVAGAVGVGRMLDPGAERGSGVRWLVLAFGLCAVSLVNPSGWAGWLHPFSILADLSANRELYQRAIEEFLPTFAHDPRVPYDRTACLVLGTLALLALAGRLVARLRGSLPAAFAGDGAPVKTELGEPEDGAGSAGQGWVVPAVVLAILFGAMLPSLRRNMAPFALVMAGPAAAALPMGLQRSRALGAVALALVAAVCAGEVSDATSLHDGLQRRWGPGLSTLSYPDQGIDFIAEHRPDGKVYTAFRYGSRFTGRRWPEQVASTNGNTHGYPTAWLERVTAAAADDDPMAFRGLVREHGFDVALLPMDGPLAARLVRESDWSLVFLGRHEAVFVREETVAPDWLAAHDLEARLASGDLPELPRAEARPWFGVERPAGPVLRAAALCVASVLPDAALGYARRAVEQSPHDGQAQGLLGLLLVSRGRTEQGLSALRASVAAGDVHPLQERVRKAIEAAGD